MAYSYVVYTGNGSTTQFAITFPYIRKEHIKVYVNYVDTAYTYVNDTTVQLATAPASPLRVEVRRVTPLANVLVDYTDGSTLIAADLDTSNLQSLYNEQELDDSLKQTVSIDPATGLLSAGSQRITNVANPVNAQDAATKTYVDTADALKVAKAGDSMTGALAMGNNKITGLGTPTTNTDAATKTYVDTADALKVAKAGDTMTGALAMSTNKITGMGDPVNAQDAATKTYVDTANALKVAKAGDTMTGALAMGNNKITGLGTPTTNTDAATKAYVDANAGGAAIADGDYGDVVVSGTATVWTVDSGAITNAKINASAAIDLSKLATGALPSAITVASANIVDGTIVNADVNASAAIAATKLSVTSTNSIVRTVDSKLKDFTNAKDFGAVGDGSTDDTAAINAAINAVVALGGGNVYLPPGNYKISSTLTLPGRVSLIGAGTPGSEYQPTYASTTSLSWYGGAAAMVQVGWQGGVNIVRGGGVEKIYLDGRNLATYGLSIKDIQFAFFQELHIIRTITAGIYLTNSSSIPDPTGFSKFDSIHIALRNSGGPAQNAHGILLDGQLGAGTVTGVTLCTWYRIRIEHANGDGIRVNECGDGMSWFFLYTFSADAETGYAINCVGSSAAVISCWAVYNSLPNASVYVAQPGIAKGWYFDVIQDIDVKSSRRKLVYGPGMADVTVNNTSSGRIKGIAKINGYRTSVIGDAMYLRRVDGANNIFNTAQNQYLIGGTFGSIESAGQPGGATRIITQNSTGSALYFSAAGVAAEGYTLNYEPQMAALLSPINTGGSNYIMRVGFVDSFADTPSNGYYVQAAPGTSAYYQCIMRNSNTQTTTTTIIGLSDAFAVHWRIEANLLGIAFLCRTTGNDAWAVVASFTTGLPTAVMADVVYIRTLANEYKTLHIHDYKLAWNTEL